MDFLSDFRSQPTVERPAATVPVAPPPVVAPSAPQPPAYVPPAPAGRHEAPVRAPRPPLTWASLKDVVLNPTENLIATAALCLGLASVLLPLLALAGIGMGLVSLNRSRRRPWVRGRARAYGAIAASVLLGSLSSMMWMQLLGVG